MKMRVIKGAPHTKWSREFCGICRSAVWLLFAVSALTARAQEEFNILANDDDHGFKPKIGFSESSADRVRGIRSDGEVTYEVSARPGRLSATLTGNLVQFPFSEIAEDMSVGVSIGGFSFEATLGDDATRRVDRDGNPFPFETSKHSAVFYFEGEFPPASEDGEPRIRRVGVVKFTWTTQTVTARVLVSNVEAAGLTGIYDRASLIDAAGFDSERGGATIFKNEPVEASLTFGSAFGSRILYGSGRVRTVYKKVGSEARGNEDILQKDSLLALGGADIAAAKLEAEFPALDVDADGLISFNGTALDLAPSTLSGEIFPVSLQLFLDGTPLVSDLDDADFADYSLSMSDPDSNGQSIFTVTNLTLPGDGGRHQLVIEAVDGSGNVRKMEGQVADSGASR